MNTSTPGSLADRRDHIVVGLVEIEMIILVVYDWLASIPRCSAVTQNLQTNTVRVMSAVAVQQQEVADIQ
jgi:hypothetical protein